MNAKDSDDQKLFNMSYGSRSLITSVAVGNFDENKNGCEQVAFMVGYKHSGAAANVDNYNFTTSMISGTVSDSSVTYTGAKISSDVGYHEINDKGDNENEYLNALVVAVDTDNDGTLVRRNTTTPKSFIYTDQEVLAILEAAPYYGELNNIVVGTDRLSDSGSTTYSISQMTGTTESDSIETSLQIGGKGSLETTVFQLEASTGYGREWSKSWEDSMEYENEEEFEATDTNTVVVYRTPIIIYLYDVLKSDGTLVTEGDPWHIRKLVLIQDILHMEMRQH